MAQLPLQRYVICVNFVKLLHQSVQQDIVLILSNFWSSQQVIISLVREGRRQFFFKALNGCDGFLVIRKILIHRHQMLLSVIEVLAQIGFNVLYDGWLRLGHLRHVGLDLLGIVPSWPRGPERHPGFFDSPLLFRWVFDGKLLHQGHVVRVNLAERFR